MIAEQMHAAEAAWVVGQDGAYVARGTREVWGPIGPVLPLILGVYDLLGRESLRVLRKKIITTSPVTPLDQAVARVAAKSCRYEEGLARLEIPSGVTDVSCSELREPASDREVPVWGTPISRQAALELAAKLASEMQMNAERYLSSRRVAAVLVDGAGVLRGASVNSNAVNRARHAEVNLALSWWSRERRLIPAGSTLYVTLSPCRMCAELLARLSADQHGLKVVAIERDLGTHGRHNLIPKLDIVDLDSHGLQAHPPADRPSGLHPR